MTNNNYKQLVGFLLPEGILEYFEITKYSQTGNNFNIFLEEKNIVPQEYKSHKLLSKGFYPEICIQDFPIRDKALFLHIKRRRWLDQINNKLVSRNWDLVSSGTRITSEFGSFLKEIIRHSSYKL